MIVTLVDVSEAAAAALTPLLVSAGHTLRADQRPDLVLSECAELSALRLRFPNSWLVSLMSLTALEQSAQAQGESSLLGPTENRPSWDSAWPIDAPKAELRRHIQLAEQQIKLQQEREWHHSLLSSQTVGVFRTDLSKVVFLNDALVQMLGIDNPGELIDTQASLYFAEKAEWEQLTAQLREQHQITAFEASLVGKHRRAKRLLISASRTGSSVTGVAIDLTETKRVEADLRASEELLQRLLDATPSGVIFIGLDGSIGVGNQEAQELLGQSQDELSGKRISELESQLLGEDGRPLAPSDSPLGLALQTGEVQPPKVIGVRSSQQLRWVMLKTVPVRDPDSQELIGAFATLLDITSRKLAEQQTQRSESRYRELVQRSPDPMSIIVGGRLVFANQVFLHLIGAKSESELLGKAFLDLFEPSRRFDLEERSKQLFEGGHIAPLEERLLKLDGSEAWVELAATAVSFEGKPALFVSLRDISARRETEHKLRRYEARMQHTQKLESLGILAGGIAHDFNNLLVAIVGNADLARLRLDPSSPAIGYLDRIQAAAQRATDLTNQMLAYSGKSRFIVTEIDMSELVLEMSELLSSVISKRARIHHDLGRELPMVEADAAQLGQVVMNLITNASDALNGQPGDIFISTRLVDVDRGFLQQTYLDEGLPEGRYICLEVRDTGCGMDEATRSRIFDPFFTTKATGRGLGLAATLGIVRGHRGAVRIDTRPGGGTLFRIYLPCSNSPSNRAQSYAASAPARNLKDASVLIIDSEPLVLEMATEQLARLGMKALTASSCVQALELLERRGVQVDLVLLDIGVQDLADSGLIQQLVVHYPLIRLLLSGGYTDEANLRALLGEFGQESELEFLQKPYTQLALKLALTQALQTRARPNSTPPSAR